jgi:hypothetical protein
LRPHYAIAIGLTRPQRNRIICAQGSYSPAGFALVHYFILSLLFLLSFSRFFIVFFFPKKFMLGCDFGAGSDLFAACPDAMANFGFPVATSTLLDKYIPNLTPNTLEQPTLPETQRIGQPVAQSSCSAQLH